MTKVGNRKWLDYAGDRFCETEDRAYDVAKALGIKNINSKNDGKQINAECKKQNRASEPSPSPSPEPEPFKDLFLLFLRDLKIFILLWGTCFITHCFSEFLCGYPAYFISCPNLGQHEG